MASFAMSATTGGARKHARTKTMASFASSATTGGARKTPGPRMVHASSLYQWNVLLNLLTEGMVDALTKSASRVEREVETAEEKKGKSSFFCKKIKNYLKKNIF